MFLVKGGEDLRLDQRIEQVTNRASVAEYDTQGWSQSTGVQ